MAKGRKKKDRFDDLPGEFKEAVAGMKDDEIKTRIAQISMQREALAEAKKLDMDLSEAQARASQAGEVYRDGEKQAKLGVSWCRQVLKDRGRDVP